MWGNEELCTHGLSSSNGVRLRFLQREQSDPIFFGRQKKSKDILNVVGTKVHEIFSVTR